MSGSDRHGKQSGAKEKIYYKRCILCPDCGTCMGRMQISGFTDDAVYHCFSGSGSDPGTGKEVQGIKKAEKDTRDVKKITGKITKIAQAVIDGTSHYYVMLEGSDDIFDTSVVDFIDIVKCEVGQTISLEYKEGDKANTVMSLKTETNKESNTQDKDTENINK